LSGAPIVDCKKALAENDGDINQALDWLRQHGVAKATKKLSGREAEEGLVACAISSDSKSATIVKISSETDFAGKSETFVKLATHVAEATLTSDGKENVTVLNPESILGLEYDSKTVQLMLEEAIVAIRENLGIAEAIKMTSTDENSMIVPYVHGKVDTTSNAGSAASIVEISGKAVKENPTKAQEIGKKLAMHIVAAKPSYLNPNEVPRDVVEKEKAILETQIADSNKPPEVIEKIVNGRLHKFYADVCLTEQEHMVEEGNPKVSKFLKDHGLVVTGYRLLSI
jgi:elongation factor Ts